MAENSEESDGNEWNYGNWFGGLIQTVKETSTSAFEVVKTQTASAVELVKRDVSEFSQTMQCDTSNAAAKIKDQIRPDEEESGHGGRIKAGIGTILGGISKLLMVEPDSGDEDEEVLISKSGPVFDSSKARLQTLRLDPDTYCTEIDDIEDFHRWLENFIVDDHKGDISELLVTNPEIRAIYTQAVPSDLSHSLFWQRYFYRVHCLEQDEMRRSQLKQRAQSIETSIHEDINMGEDWVDFDTPASPIRTSFVKPNTKSELEEPSAITMTHDAQESSPSEHSSQSNVQTGATDSDDESVVNISERSSPERAKQNFSLGAADAIMAEDGRSSSIDIPSEDSLALEVQLKTREKGDMVLVGGRNGNTPTDSGSSNKDSVASLEPEDWDDIDVEVTEADLKVAEEMAKSLHLDQGDGADDWENWE